MYATIRDARLFFDVDGLSHRPTDAGGFDERPTVVLVHGGPGSTHRGYTRGSASCLREVAQLVYFDARGCGLSEGAPNTTIDDDVADLDALRSHLGLERITVLGTSYGGMVAIGYAITHGEHVARLVLVGTAPSHRFLADARRNLAARGTPEQQAVAVALWSGTFGSTADLTHFYEVMGPLYANDYVSGQASNEWGVDLMSWRAANIGFGGFLRSFDYVDRLSSITCPTLVLCGADDWICPPAQSRVIAAGIPGAVMSIVAGAGHGLADDEPETFLGAVRTFLAR